MMAPRLVALLVVALAVGPRLAADEIQATRLFRDGSPGIVYVVRAARGTGAGETVVFALQGPGGRRLFLRRGPSGPDGVLHEVWLETRPGLSVTRRGNEPATVEGGGWTLRVFEGDLGRRTVRCWLGLIASKVDSRLLTAASDVRVLYETSGLGSLDLAFYPVWLLWRVDEPASVAPAGALRSETKTFTGEPWETLTRLANEELGRN
ncbi:MAG: hypothetical protein ACHQPI_13240 [Thermoanaerobaculia bacterium]